MLACHINCKLDSHFRDVKKEKNVLPTMCLGGFFISALGACPHFLWLHNVPLCGYAILYSAGWAEFLIFYCNNIIVNELVSCQLIKVQI